MRDHKLSMFTKTFITIVLLMVTISLTFRTDALAQDESDNEVKFLTEYDLTYDIKENGEAVVTQNITITNLKNDVIVTSYSLTINQMKIFNIQASSNEKKITVAETNDESNNTTSLTANFAEHIVGEGRQNNLTIKYNSNDIATKFGEIWNLSIPRIELSESTTRYNVTVNVPKSFGKKIFITPKPDIEKINDDFESYSFTKETLNNQSVNASFGEFQHVNFNLRYQIENPYYIPSTYEVAFPPDIKGVQQVKYENIEPEPKRVFVDTDGNTLAYFRLKSKQKIEIKVKGSARIAGHQTNTEMGGKFSDIPNEIFDKYTSDRKYWESDSDKIKEMADSLYDNSKNVSENAKTIYDHIVSNLEYDLESINLEKSSSIERQGAERAADFINPGVCMEYTDLFIALARAMGIPAREINGYAFTNEESNKPLSISFSGADLLHSWPEYFDPNFGWVQIDPTWGKTSGIDYFTKLDTNHFAFIIRGIDSEYPIPAGAYRFEGNENDKLIEVEFSQSKDKTEFGYKINIEKKLNWNLIKLIQGYNKLKVSNTGDTFIYDLQGEDLAPKNSKVIYLKRDEKNIEFTDFNNSVIKYPLN